MFITKKHIPRRAFLRGAGVALALPLLDSMVPAQTPLARTAANPKTRFTGIFVPHGMAPGYWVPEWEARASRSPPGAAIRISDDHEAARAFPRPDGDHERPVVEIGRTASRP